MSDSVILSDKELLDIAERIDVLKSTIRERTKSESISLDELSLYFFVLNQVKDTEKLLGAFKIAQRRLILNSF